MRFESIELLSQTTLWKLYEHARNGGQRLTLSSIRRLFKVNVPDIFLQHAVRKLVEDDLVDNILSMVSPSEYWITTEGITRVQQFLRDRSSVLNAYLAEGDQWLEGNEDFNSSGNKISVAGVAQAGTAPSSVVSKEIPASDRIVKLDHNSDPYRRAVAALDQAVQEFKTDNTTHGFSAEDKSQWIGELEAGQRLLQSDQVSVSSFSATALKALRWLTSKFSSGLVYESASRALAKLIELLGDGV